MAIIKTHNKPSFSENLNNRMVEFDTWKSFSDAVTRVIDEEMTKPRRRISDVHDPYAYHTGTQMLLDDGTPVIITSVSLLPDKSAYVYYQRKNSTEVEHVHLTSVVKNRSTLVNQSLQHGFNYYSDIFSNEDYARISRYIEQYWRTSATQDMGAFMGFMLNTRLRMEALWSQVVTDGDYYPFLETQTNAMIPLWEGGPYFPTSHVQLVYDALVTPDIDDLNLFKLFYLLAPVQLVLERIVAEIIAEPFDLITTVKANIHHVDEGVVLPDLHDWFTNAFTVLPAGIHYIDQAVYDQTKIPRKLFLTYAVSTEPDVGLVFRICDENDELVDISEAYYSIEFTPDDSNHEIVRLDKNTPTLWSREKGLISLKANREWYNLMADRYRFRFYLHITTFMRASIGGRIDFDY